MVKLNFQHHYSSLQCHNKINFFQDEKKLSHSKCLNSSEYLKIFYSSEFSKFTDKKLHYFYITPGKVCKYVLHMEKGRKFDLH